MLKNKIFKYGFFVFLIFIIAFVIELFIFNFKPLFLYGNNVKDISDKVEINNNEISLKLDKSYVNKLIINYSADENVKVKINYKSNNGYDKYIKSEIDDTFSKERNRLVINFNKKIDTVTINSDSLEKLHIKSVCNDFQVHFNIYRFIFVFLLLLLLSLSYFFYRNKIINKQLHFLYFLISLFFGISIICFQPATTFASWDDQIHYMNSYSLFGHKINWRAGDVLMYDNDPENIKTINSAEENEDYSNYMNNQSKFDHFSESEISYGKVGYVFFGIILFIGRIFNLSFTFYFKFAKIFNLIFYSLGMAYVIKKAKIGKKTIFGIALIPTVVFLSSQYSYDHFVTLGIFLSTVQIINTFVDEKEKIDFKWMVIFLVGILGACFIKAVYVVFILLFLLVPKERFVNKKQMIKLRFLIFIVFLLIMSTFVLPTINGSFVADYRGGDTSVSKQLALILKHPFAYLEVLKNTMFKEFVYKFFGIYTIGSFAYLGNVSSNCYLVYLIYLIVLACSDKSSYHISVKERFSILFVLLCTILLIWTALYLAFTPVGNSSIGGVQGRYFIPIMYALYLCFSSSSKKNVKNGFNDLLIVFVPIFVLSFVVYSLLLVPFCI